MIYSSHIVDKLFGNVFVGSMDLILHLGIKKISLDEKEELNFFVYFVHG